MEKFILLLAEALEKEDAINPADLFRDYEEWDSLSVLSVLATVNENYGLTIPRTDFDKQKTIEDMYNYISSRSAN